MPVEGKLDQYRSHQEIEVKLPHEQMWKEEQMLPFQTPAEIEELDVFKLHPAYMALPDNEKQYARPVSIYLDVAKYTRRNNFWGIYIRNLRTRFEHLFAVFRKEDLCRCGCRGWDSFYPVFQVLVWSLNCGTAGDWPTRRHDDGEFQSPRDNWRSTRPSMGPMGIHLIVCELRGDWPAMNLILGQRGWKHLISPCPLCKVRKTHWHLHSFGFGCFCFCGLQGRFRMSHRISYRLGFTRGSALAGLGRPIIEHGGQLGMLSGLKLDGEIIGQASSKNLSPPWTPRAALQGQK